MEMEKEVLTLNLDDVLPNRFQPRIKFNEQNILELAESIKEHGVIQPIVVRKIGDKYEIIAGERRYKASVLAGKTTIPAIVTNLDDKNSAEIALIENVQRQDLTPIEEAVSYKKILDMGYLNQATLAEKLGKTQSTIANKLRLLNLDDEVQEALLEEKISERHARSLLKLNPKDQVKMLNRILTERLTVRKTDDEITKMLAGNETEESSEQSVKENIEPQSQIENLNDAVITEIPKQVEILDFNESVNMGGQDMEENINHELNIPTAPIIEEIEPIEPKLEAEQISPINEINPGFLDVEKIKNQAKDIYEAQPIINPIVPEEAPVIEPEPTVTIDPIPVAPLEAQPLPKVEEDDTTSSSGNRFFTMFNRNEEDVNPNYVSDIESKEVNMGGINPQPNTVFNFNPFEQVQPVKEEPTIQPKDSSTVTTPNFLNQIPVESPQQESVDDFIRPVNPYTLTDDQVFTNTPEDVNISQVQSLESSSDVTEIKEEQPISYNEIPTENIRPVPMEDVMNNPIPQSFITEPEKIVTADFKTIINTIRNCAKTIENYGYTIDTEELDFENSYQVTFKIEK